MGDLLLAAFVDWVLDPLVHLLQMIMKWLMRLEGATL